MTSGDQNGDLNEQSPLIGPADTGQDEDVERGSSRGMLLIDEESKVESKSTLYLILLTLSVGGLQIVWSVELGNGSPYLISLGMSKALVAFVWLAGPLTGVLVQPYIGILSDQSRISWGKRKPFMLAGAAGTVVGSLLLAYIKDIIQFMGRWSSDDQYGGAWQTFTIIFATILMWCLDFAINTVQAAIRAFIVDNAPAHQQESANAWASRLTGVGNVLGYIFGFLDLPKVFWYFGNTQFKVLCVIASIAITSTVLLSCLVIKERNPNLDPTARTDHSHLGLVSFFKQTFRSIARLSPTVRSVCEIQFFHWIGWFPFLFYATTYVGQLYVNPRLRPDMTKEEVDELWATATRVGTFALLVEAIVSFSANTLLPFFLDPTYKPPSKDDDQSQSDRASANTRSDRSATISKVYHMICTGELLRKMQISGLTLRRMWLVTQILHALCMFSTFFISTPTGATIMVSFVGISWALTLWAPFALISADIANADQLRRSHQRRRGGPIANSGEENSEATTGLMQGDEARANKLTGESSDHDEDDDGRSDTIAADETNINNPYSQKPSSNTESNRQQLQGEGGAAATEEEESDSAGVILGLHNVAVSSPQILATLITSAIFKALQKDRGTPGDESVAWALRLGGVAALVAAFFTYRMKESVR